MERWPIDTPERRSHLRLPASYCSAVCSAGEVSVLNICSSGLALETAAGTLDDGERYIFIVSDRRGHTFEVLGEVRWRRGSSRVTEAVGIGVLEVLRDDPDGSWTGVKPYRDTASRPSGEEPGRLVLVEAD